MTGRIAEICSVLPRVRVFADVGCDHGYMAQDVLKRGLAELVYISDVSEGSLRKARRLLKEEIAEGRCIPVCADGMKGLPETVDCLLIAGLGGEEIVRILSEGYLPEQFVFQPMHNPEKLRRYLSERGADLKRDYTFADGKYYYDLIAGRRSGGGRDYTEEEIFFGRENLLAPSPAFSGKWREEAEKLKTYLSREVSGPSRAELTARLKRIEQEAAIWI